MQMLLEDMEFWNVVLGTKVRPKRDFANWGEKKKKNQDLHYNGVA